MYIGEINDNTGLCLRHHLKLCQLDTWEGGRQ